MAPRVFISYTHADSWFVDNLAADLDASGVDVWIDKWEIKIGDSIIQSINEAISESAFLIVVLSKNSVASKWVREEMNAAIYRNIEEEKGFSILPVVIEKCKIPPLIAQKKYADFSKDPEIALRDLIASLGTDFAGELRTKSAHTFIGGFKIGLAFLTLPIGDSPTQEEFHQARADLKEIVEAYEMLVRKPNRKRLSLLRQVLRDLERGTFGPISEDPKRIADLQQAFFSLPSEIADSSKGKLYHAFYLGYVLSQIALAVPPIHTGDLETYVDQLGTLLDSDLLKFPHRIESQLRQVSQKSEGLMDFMEIQNLANRILLYFRGAPYSIDG